MNDWRNLPSQQEVNRVSNWGLLSVAAMLVAAFVPIGISKLVPGLPIAAALAIFGALMIPVFICFGITIQHTVRSLKLRKAEQREGRIIYSNKVGAFLDQHPRIVIAVALGGSLMVALVWTLLENK